MHIPSPLILAVLFSCFTTLACTDSQPESVTSIPTAIKVEQLEKANVIKGLASYQQSKYKEAHGILHPLAVRDEVSSQSVLGEMYMMGNGVSRSAEESFKWYLSAAEQEHAQSQYQVASMYAHGTGVPQNLAQAFVWSQARPSQRFFGKGTTEKKKLIITS
ncbi:MAG: tetratricopeptide repeat protein [Sedimenticola sp.]